jgi:hypothetical protein
MADCLFAVARVTLRHWDGLIASHPASQPDDLLPLNWRRIVLDIDDTSDMVHGQQELALFNTHAGGHCFQPIHILCPRTAPLALAGAGHRTLDWCTRLGDAKLPKECDRNRIGSGQPGYLGLSSAPA